MKIKRIATGLLSLAIAIGTFSGCDLIEKEPWTESDIAAAASTAGFKYTDASTMIERNKTNPLTDEAKEAAEKLGLSEVIFVSETALKTGKGGLVSYTKDDGTDDTLIGVLYFDSSDESYSVYKNICKQIDGYDFGNATASSSVNGSSSGHKYINGSKEEAYVSWNQNYVAYLLYFSKSTHSGNAKAFFENLP